MAKSDKGAGLGTAARIALAGTALLLVAAVGYRALRERSPDAPAVASQAAGPTSIVDLERQVSTNATDPALWQRLGAAYFEQQRYAEAATAYAHATELQPRNSELWSALGEARVLAANNVGQDAHTAFATALSLDSKDPRARYFLAVEKDIAGDHRGALDDWLALLADSPPDAPWTASVRALVEQVAARDKVDISKRLPPGPATSAAPAGDLAAAAIPGPTPEQMAAAAQLTPTQQDGMARAMVARLAARLQEDPRDAEGWIRLMRARSVLGETEGARTALADARKVFADDATVQARLADAARTLGIAAP